jgi:hypothetical protein
VKRILLSYRGEWHRPLVFIAESDTFQLRLAVRGAQFEADGMIAGANREMEYICVAPIAGCASGMLTGVPPAF